MILVVKGSGAEVDQPDLAVEEHTSLTGRAGSDMRRGRNVAVVGEGLICPVDEQDVFRLQVGVNEIEVMQDCHPP